MLILRDGGFCNHFLEIFPMPNLLVNAVVSAEARFLVPELNPNHNSCGNERWRFLLGFSSKSVSYIYIFFSVPSLVE